MGGGHAYGKPHKKQHRARKDDHDAPKPKTGTEMSTAAGTGTGIGYAIMAILKNSPKYISEASPEFAGGLSLINEGVNGDHPATDCIQFIEAGLAALGPGLAGLESDPEGKAWLDTYALGPLDTARERKRAAIPGERVDAAKKRIETETQGQSLGADDQTREQAKQLHAHIPNLVGTLQRANEEIMRWNHDKIHHAIEKELEVATKAEAKELAKVGLQNLSDLQAALWGLDAFLLLGEDEFYEHLTEFSNVWKTVTSYTELVKVVTELAGTGVVIGAHMAGLIASIKGDAVSAATCRGIAHETAHVFSNIIAGIEIAHGVVVLLDPDASAEEKMLAAGDVATNTTWLVAGAPLGLATELGKAELELILQALGDTEIGLEAGTMAGAFHSIRESGMSILETRDRVTTADRLIAQETDPARTRDLDQARDRLVQQLKSDVMRLVDSCEPKSVLTGGINLPGGYHVLIDVLEPAKAIAGASTAEEIKAVADIALSRCVYALQHQRDLVIAGVDDISLVEMEREIEENKNADKNAEIEQAQRDSDEASSQRKMRESSQWDRHH